MFGLFNKKSYQPTVTPEDKEWIEKNISWFIEAFGFEKLRAQPFMLPVWEHFPYNNLKDGDQFKKLFDQLCGHWDLNPDEIIIKIFDDIKSKQWETLMPQGTFNEPVGMYNQIYTSGEKRFNIQLAKSNLENPQLLIAVIAHELAHVKLLGGNYISRTDRDLEPFTDLACIYFGFGIFLANSVQSKDLYWISRTGYLPNQLISYANALVCYITDHDAGRYYSVLNGNTIDLFKKDFNFLVHTHDTALIKNKISALETNYKIGKQITDGFDKRNFSEVIVASSKVLETDPRNYIAYNNIGYALLQQKNYEEAIEQFTKAITIEPYWDYPYNNRGYCKLQLNDMDNAFIDLYHSFEMNPENSYSWRNLGAYYLKNNDCDKALQHFEEAEKIDPKTEMINFYLGKAHLKVGNIELGQKYLNKSKDLNEHIDSTME